MFWPTQRRFSLKPRLPLISPGSLVLRCEPRKPGRDASPTSPCMAIVSTFHPESHSCPANQWFLD
jgi:hypothetical protein